MSETIAGVVLDRDPLIQLVLYAADGATRTETAVVDTGYQGAVAAPDALFDHVRRGRATPVAVRLADGTTFERRAAVAEVQWCGERVRTRILGGASQVLVGMELLAHHRLTVDCVDGGPVTIEPLSR